MTTASESFDRRILNAIPLIIFVVDEDVRIVDLNDTASANFGLDQPSALQQRGGEAMHCLHATENPGGCGRSPSCQACVIRGSVGKCLQGQAVFRRRTKASLVLAGGRKELELLITTNPLPGSDPQLALLIIEDITEMSTLQDIIPICAKCKKIRDDQQYWQSVERYFSAHLGVEFTHGICPACTRELYPDFPMQN